jgi:hypothetical protein
MVKSKLILSKKDKLKIRIVEVISAIVGFASMFGCIEIREIENNLQGTKLFVLFAILGLIISIGLIVILYKWIPIGIKERRKNTLISGGILCGFILGLPCLANYYNRTDFNEVICKSYVINKMYFKHGRSGGHFLYIDIDNKEKRLNVDHKTYHELERENKVEICIAKGRLNFDFVESINLNKK